MQPTYFNTTQRLSQRRKDANDYQWYKDQADRLDSHSFGGSHFFDNNGISSTRRKKVNYDLFNNIININEFKYVCKPYGAETGDLPANFTNRDIISGKVKVLHGMEMKMPFSWRVIATNEAATTRKEQKETEMLRDFVIGQIMRPLRQSIESQLVAQNKNRELTPQEQQQLQQQIEEETQARTPDEVRRYMTREHQDPAELLNHQILEYLIIEQKINDKFNKGWKHSTISGEEIYWVGILNAEPCLKVVNPLYFDYAGSPDEDPIEDSEWATYEFRLTPSQVIAAFGSELSDEDIDKIYSFEHNAGSPLTDATFTFDDSMNNDAYTVRVRHFTWKSLRKVGFLKYYSAITNTEELKIVDENYKINKIYGDISIDWEWIPEAHETYKILSDIYAYTRPIPGQHKDIDNLYKCKLPYIGAACDNLNSITTSPMDRGKGYQYYYNVILYRIELLMASDKGKILAANIGAIPKSAGLDINKFTYFMEANKIAWLNPGEEGNKGGSLDVTNMVKEIDMSLAGDIGKYIEFAEYIKEQCGAAMGVTRQMEAQIGPQEAVTNTKQNLIQASHIVQPYFELHNTVKSNVLQALLETAKVAYSQSKPRKLTYILDDMTQRMLTIDPELLDNSTCGLFVTNSSKAADAKRAVESLAQAAIQNQQADLADIIRVVRSESITEAEELLEAAQMRKRQEEQAIEQQKIQSAERLSASQEQTRLAERQHEKEIIILKEKEKRKTEIQKQTILSLGFNEDKDLDDDGTPDVLEVAKFGVDAKIQERRLSLDERKLDHQIENDHKKNTQKDKEIKIKASKPAAKVT